MLPYGFERDNIPSSYEPISWMDKLERIPSDYGEPQQTYGERPVLEDLESNADYMLNRGDAPW